MHALFGVVNTGDFDTLDAVVADDYEVYANGYRLKVGNIGKGAGLVVEGLRRFRDSFEDLRWELFDEEQDDEGEHTKLRHTVCPLRNCR